LHAANKQVKPYLMSRTALRDDSHAALQHSNMSDPESQLAAFVAKFTPEIGERARLIIEKLRHRLPAAIILVYDNYNALAVGFAPSERTSDAILSVAIYPRWVSLFFLQARGLNDPARLLKGTGTVARHIVLPDHTALDHPGISALIDQALSAARVPLPSEQTGRVVVKSISQKQRPRRPPEKVTS
jgi:hypothetical protein